MKKVLIAVVVILLLVGLVGAAYYKFAKSKTPVAMNNEEHGSVFASIQDALSKSLSLQCMFTDSEGRKTTAYIKAGAVRTDTLGTNPSAQYNNASVIVKDKKIYFWDNTTKQGMTMQMPDEEMKAPTGVVVTPAAGSASPQNAGDVVAMLEKYKNDCKPAVVADSLFTPPTDIKFTDASQMMHPSGVPSTVPSGMTQQQVQQMMQQYQHPTAPAGY